MSKSAAGKFVDVATYGQVSAFSGGTEGVAQDVLPQVPDVPTEELPVRGAEGPKNTTEQVATRDQQQRIALAASGITPTPNGRDKLGGAPTTKSASRLLLGGR